MSLKSRFMARNVGAFDRVLRTLPSVAVAAGWATGALSGTPLILLGIVAAMLLVTALTARCSIYALVGWSTCPVEEAQPQGEMRC